MASKPELTLPPAAWKVTLANGDSVNIVATNCFQTMGGGLSFIDRKQRGIYGFAPGQWLSFELISSPDLESSSKPNV